MDATLEVKWKKFSCGVTVMTVVSRESVGRQILACFIQHYKGTSLLKVQY